MLDNSNASHLFIFYIFFLLYKKQIHYALHHLRRSFRTIFNANENTLVASWMHTHRQTSMPQTVYSLSVYAPLFGKRRIGDGKMIIKICFFFFSFRILLYLLENVFSLNTERIIKMASKSCTTWLNSEIASQIEGEISSYDIVVHFRRNPLC